MSGGAAAGRRRIPWPWRRRKQKPPEGTMTMMQHLGELRTRLIVSAAAFLTISVVVFFFYPPILDLLRAPLCDVPDELLGAAGCELQFFKVQSAFLFRLKLTAMVGIALSSPIWLYEIYAFVVPALTQKERRYTIPFLASSTFLFLFGATFAYLAMPTGIRFLIGIGGEGLSPFLGAEEYLNFVGLMLLGFGVTFELPLVLIFLGLVGVVSVEQLKRHRRAAVVAIAFLAAIVTPSQDPYTMLGMALPLYIFYELTIVILRLVLRKRPKSD